jgi:rhamnosyltransferase
MIKIVAVVVTYYPNDLHFKALLSSLGGQCDKVIIVDNTESIDDPISSCFSETEHPNHRFHLIRLCENCGIAKALNVGIQCAFDEGADFVLLSDQDSLPENGMVGGLFLAYSELSAVGVRVGAVGPTFADLHRAITIPFQVQLPGRLFYGHQAPTTVVPHVEALSLISSGSLIPVPVLKDVGLMREEFFIDKVDIEWCHRARAKGYRIFGTGLARMHQRLGERKLKIWYFGWVDDSVYSPLRVYYQLRNYVAICRLDYVDLKWKVRNGWHALGIFYAQVGFGETRWASCRMGLLGVWHGILKRMGRYA